MYSRCQMCGRKLTDPESMVRGYGPECWSDIVKSVSESLGMGDYEVIPGQMRIEDFLKEEDE